MSATDVLPSTSDIDTDDPENLAHYSANEGLTEAMIFGTEIVALCGHRFVPMRDPLRFPICKRCKDIYESLPS